MVMTSMGREWGGGLDIHKENKEKEKGQFYLLNCFAYDKPLSLTSSRGLFRVKWPGPEVPFSVIKEASRASGSEQHLTQRVMGRRKREGN